MNIILKFFDSIFYILHFPSNRLFSKDGCDAVFSKTYAYGYHVPPSVETGCSPYSFTMFDRKRSDANISRSFV
jgi:hypothetical protein